VCRLPRFAALHCVKRLPEAAVRQEMRFFTPALMLRLRPAFAAREMSPCTSQQRLAAG